MLNIAQVRQSIKRDISNGTAPGAGSAALQTGNLTAYSLAVKTLKAQGWSSCNTPTGAIEMHPVDRVPVFRLGICHLRRNKETNGWIVGTGDSERAIPATAIDDLTAQAQAMNEEANRPLSRISYDRSARDYVVRNGSLVGRYPDRVQAERAAIEHDSPALFAHYQDFIDRFSLVGNDPDAFDAKARKACRLVLRERVDVEAATVTSETTGEVYAVNGSCGCDDYQFRGHGKFFCKHQMALHLAGEMTDAPDGPCADPDDIPFDGSYPARPDDEFEPASARYGLQPAF